MSDLVTAIVPDDWLHLHIGRRLWSKPETLGYSTYGYHRLVDVIHEATTTPQYPIRLKAIIDYEGQRHEVLIPHACTVEDVPQSECELIDNGLMSQWTWIPQHPTIRTNNHEQYALI